MNVALDKMCLRSSLWCLSWGSGWFELQAPLSGTIMAITALIIALNCPSFCAAVETVWLRLCSGKDGLGALQRSEEIHCSVNQVLLKLVS